MVNRIFSILCALLLGVCVSAQSLDKVEAIKKAIPNPKYEVGDTLYISFIKDSAADSRFIRPSDLTTHRVVVIDCRLANFDGGVYLSLPVADFPLSWEYQYLDTAIKNAKYSNRSDFFPENRFGITPADAEQTLIENE